MKIVSATSGPSILKPLFLRLLIVGPIILYSSEFFRNSELCGLRPSTPILGFFL